MLRVAAQCSARLRWLTGVVSLAWAWSSVAWGQTDAARPAAVPQAAGESTAAVSERDKSEARRLGSEAFAALDGGDYPRAVERFTQALAHYDAPTLRLARAQALEAQGKWLAALEDLRRAASQAASSEEPASFPQARAQAKARQTRLESRIPTLTVHAPEQAEVRVNGQLWSLQGPHPLDPGEHRITVRSAGQTWARQIELSEGAREAVSFPGAAAAGSGQTPAPVAPAAAAQPAAAGSASSGSEPSSVAPEEAAGDGSVAGSEQASSSEGQGERTPAAGAPNVPLVVAATTTAVLAVAAVATGWVALGARSDYEDENRPEVNRSRKQDLRSRALTWSWVNTATTAGAVLAGGVTAYFWFSPPLAAAPSEAGARPWLVGVTGSF